MDIFSILDIKVHSFASADELISYAWDRKGILVAVNAEKTVNATQQLKDIINQNIGYCDGAGAVKAAKTKGCNKAVRIPGCELWLNIIRKYHKSHSFYLIGTTQDNIEKTVAKLRNEFEGINIVGYRNGFIKDEQQKETLKNDIRKSQPDFVFVAMGSPRQEILMSELTQIHPAVYQGLGGSFDLYIGAFKRAPKVIQYMGCEWLWRFVAQPSRITRITPYLKYASLLYRGKL